MMEHARRMILVPEENAKRFQQLLNLPPTTQTPGTPLSRLDRDMYEISRSDDFRDEREKWASYQNVLERYLRKKNPDPVLPSREEPAENTRPDNDAEVENVDFVLQKVAKVDRDRAKQLLQFIDKTSNVKWRRKDGRLTIDGVELPNSNIASLISDATRAKDNKRGRPPNGRAQLSLALQRAGVPRNLVLNNNFWTAAADLSFQSSAEESPEKEKKKNVATSSPKGKKKETPSAPGNNGMTSWLSW